MSFIEVETEVKPLDKYMLYRFSGYSIRSHIYNTIFKRADPLRDIHDLMRIKFFRVTPLYRYDENGVHIVYSGRIDSDKSYYYRFTLFGSENISRYNDRIMNFLRIDNVTIDSHVYNVLNRNMKIFTLEDIDKMLGDGDKISVDYITPTYFRSPKIYSEEVLNKKVFNCICKVKETGKSVNIPLPIPLLLMKNLLRIYRNYVNNPVDEEISDLRRYINEDGLVITGFPNGIKTMVVKESRYMFNIGFLGKVYYHLREIAEDTVLRMMKLLLRIGEHTNVGGGRTAGLGWIKTEFKK